MRGSAANYSDENLGIKKDNSAIVRCVISMKSTVWIPV